jgi:hypothetical protein
VESHTRPDRKRGGTTFAAVGDPRPVDPAITRWGDPIRGMAVGDFENGLPARLTGPIARHTSAWWDMRHAAQMMHSRSELGRDPAHYFARRGLLDGAVITYARCFTTGTRSASTDIRPLLDELDGQGRETHETALWWRDKHAAHRVDASLETVSVRLLWGDWGRHAPTVRARLTTRVIPELPKFETSFEELAHKLSLRIWERYLYPLQQELFATLGTVGLTTLKGEAAPYTEPPYPVGTIGVRSTSGRYRPVPRFSRRGHRHRVRARPLAQRTCMTNRLINSSMPPGSAILSWPFPFSECSVATTCSAMSPTPRTLTVVSWVTRGSCSSHATASAGARRPGPPSPRRAVGNDESTSADCGGSW